MNLYIGENIKRLRRERGITQETLAEAINISCPAVSKWERGETYPDITMVLPLASYFGVSTDELLGLNAAENERTIQAYLDEYRRLCALGKTTERFDLMKRAYNEFPHDWRIIREHMWQLNYDPNCSDPYGAEVHKEELYRLCHRVLEECPLDTTRYTALSILGGLYLLDGRKDEAIETAKRLPPYYLTAEEELEQCHDRGTDEWWKQLRSNILEITDNLQIKIRNAALYSENREEQLRIFQKAVALMELIYDEGDYGFSHYHLSELYLYIANRYVMLDRIPEALDAYEKGFFHAKQYDDLPTVSVHTSHLVRGYVQDMMKINSGSEDNEVARELIYLRECEIYQKIQNLPQMKELVARYEPYAGKKKRTTIL